MGLWCCRCSLSSGARMLCRTICKPGLSFLFLGQLIIENFLRGPSWEGGGSLAGIGVVEIWATCLCNLFVPTGPIWSYVFYFLLMTDCCCTHPILWLGESDNTLLIMGSSHGNLMTCGQVLSQRQKQFPKRRIVICRGWYNLTSKSSSSVLWCTYRNLKSPYTVTLCHRHFDYHHICQVMWPKWQSNQDLHSKKN